MLEDSSGNGGAAVACYATAGGLGATIMAPSSTSPAKTVAMRAYGAEVELIPGSRQATADAAVAAHGREGRGGGSVFYASHAWHPFFLQGTKTLAYELWEDLGFRAPDNVILPTGSSSCEQRLFTPLAVNRSSSRPAADRTSWGATSGLGSCSPRARSRGGLASFARSRWLARRFAPLSSRRAAAATASRPPRSGTRLSPPSPRGRPSLGR